MNVQKGEEDVQIDTKKRWLKVQPPEVPNLKRPHPCVHRDRV